MTTTADPEAFLAALRAPSAAPPAGAAGASPPRWLWHLAAALYERLPAVAADAWGVRLDALLDGHPRITGLRVVHLWHADTVLPLLADASPDEEVAGCDAVTELHRASAQGRPAGPDTWRTALDALLPRLYEAAYDRAGGYADAHTGARDHALANAFTPAEADAYGHTYARLSTDANARAFAEAHTLALGDPLARAYATDDAEVYAETCPGAQLRAVVRATTTPDGPAPALHLAEGLLSALRSHRS
ncbi:hypothetical protein J2X68_005059 [Streptomyces sp. 3330]|uniref:hypothetical protein n=1 Tax=Streptomyces sp. 3330 TaxID=2817755 RepID=UPI002858795C|nr:hypothetical protein [Streptomyces sp. 3330]MDR6978333.1 hypothetical protein [Streptomyces sp. 3330]